MSVCTDGEVLLDGAPDTSACCIDGCIFRAAAISSAMGIDLVSWLKHCLDSWSSASRHWTCL